MPTMGDMLPLGSAWQDDAGHWFDYENSREIPGASDPYSAPPPDPDAQAAQSHEAMYQIYLRSLYGDNPQWFIDRQAANPANWPKGWQKQGPDTVFNPDFKNPYLFGPYPAPSILSTEQDPNWEYQGPRTSDDPNAVKNLANWKELPFVPGKKGGMFQGPGLFLTMATLPFTAMLIASNPELWGPVIAGSGMIGGGVGAATGSDHPWEDAALGARIGSAIGGGVDAAASAGAGASDIPMLTSPDGFTAMPVDPSTGGPMIGPDGNMLGLTPDELPYYLNPGQYGSQGMEASALAGGAASLIQALTTHPGAQPGIDPGPEFQSKTGPINATMPDPTMPSPNPALFGGPSEPHQGLAPRTEARNKDLLEPPGLGDLPADAGSDPFFLGRMSGMPPGHPAMSALQWLSEYEGMR